MYSILGIDKPCIFLFRTTQFIISSDFPTRICCILFQIEFLSIVKLDMLFNENERKICILKIYTEIWAFLDEVWSQLKQNWHVFCFENCSDLFWEEIAFRDWKNLKDKISHHFWDLKKNNLLVRWKVRAVLETKYFLNFKTIKMPIGTNNSSTWINNQRILR